MNKITGHWRLIAGLVVVALLAVTVVLVYRPASCAAEQCTEGKLSELEKIKREMRRGALLVDVRTSEEFTLGHATSAINFSSERIQAGEYPTDDKRQKLYLYCRSGRRASEAVETLNRAGFTNVTSIGSLEYWSKIGGSVEKGI